MTARTLLASDHASSSPSPSPIPELAELTESTTSFELSPLSPVEGEPLRHILLGSPGGVRQTIHLLHMLRYVENALWSPLVPIPNNQLMITPRQGEVMSILVRHLQRN